MPPLQGLVLAGGRSSRMGTDKARILHPVSGKPLWRHAAELLTGCCGEVFVSCRDGLAAELPPACPRLLDHAAWTGHGPTAGLLTAHLHAPDAAWLVLAVDFPFATPEALRGLLDARAPELLGTAYVNSQGFLEPLLAVWEPAGLDALAAAPARGPRRVLDTGACRRLTPDTGRLLFNVNTPEELREAGMLPPRT